MRDLNMIGTFFFLSFFRCGEMSEQHLPDVRPIDGHFFTQASFDFLHHPFDHTLVVGNHNGDDHRPTRGQTGREDA